MADHVVERAVPVLVIAHRAREHLVPAREARTDALRLNRQRRVGADGEGARIGLGHQLRSLRGEQHGPLLVLRKAGQPIRQRVQESGKPIVRRRRGVLDQVQPFLDFERGVDPCGVLLSQFVAPCREGVAPSFDRDIRKSR